jgi:ATP-dependent exoDNAse (exonuclease V) alpha subunit
MWVAVMQLENDYNKQVFNGDLGIVVRIDPEER